MSLKIQEFINKIKTVQSVISKYIEDDANYEENFQNFVSMIQNQKIQDDKHLLELLLRYISSICNNHHRNSNFFSKIERMIRFLSKEIKQFFTDIEIFHFFKSNKRLLLYLHEEQIMIIDHNILDELIELEYSKFDYLQYFGKEILLFPNFPHKKREGIHYLIYDHQSFKSWFSNLTISEDARKLGENDNDICKIIQKDMIKEFIIYINKNSISLDSRLQRSIYETNQFLLKKKVVSLIEYAAFCGSIQIFNYLRINGAELTSSLMLYAIHGNNSEIIQILDENHDIEILKEKEDKSDFNQITYEDCFLEAIKCHHNDIAFYFYDNFLRDQEKDLNEYITNYLQYYNFSFIDENLLNESDYLFNYYCKYDYYNLVEIFLSNKNINVNKTYINTSYLNKVSWTHYFTDGELKEEKSALYLAIENNNYEVAKLLLNNDKIDVNIINKEDYESKRGYVIDYDCRGIRFECDEWIREIYKVENTALLLAVEKRNIELIKLILNKNEIDINAFYKIDDINEDCNDQEVIREKKTSLYLAIEIGDIEIVKLLLNNDKIDVNLINQNGCTFTKGDHCLIEETVLNFSIGIGNIEIVKLLLSNDKIDVNTINKKLWTREPRSITFGIKPWYGHFDHDTYLQQEFTALSKAIVENNIEIVKLLLNNDKIDVNIINKYDASFFKYKNKENFLAWYEGTLLYLAIRIENIEIIKLLLENDKIDVNIMTKIFEYKFEYYHPEEEEIEDKKEEKSYSSPLHFAVKKGNLEVIDLLMHCNGIDLNVKDEQGKTPIDYANTEEIKQLLKKQ